MDFDFRQETDEEKEKRREEEAREHERYRQKLKEQAARLGWRDLFDLMRGRDWYRLNKLFEFITIRRMRRLLMSKRLQRAMAVCYEMEAQISSYRAAMSLYQLTEEQICELGQTVVGRTYKGRADFMNQARLEMSAIAHPPETIRRREQYETMRQLGRSGITAQMMLARLRLDRARDAAAQARIAVAAVEAVTMPQLPAPPSAAPRSQRPGPGKRVRRRGGRRPRSDKKVR